MMMYLIVCFVRIGCVLLFGLITCFAWLLIAVWVVAVADVYLRV